MTHDRETMVRRLAELRRAVGGTPLLSLTHPGLALFAKVEGYNFTGSSKIAPALTIVEDGVRRGLIGPQTTIIESSSGNFAAALGTVCRALGIRFVAVIDRYVNPTQERLLRLMCHDVVKVTEPDETGGFLLNRIRCVKAKLAELDDAFWPNQYANPLNARAHFDGIGAELSAAFDHLDAVYVPVSSGGMITGISQRIARDFPACRTIAVDAVGSVIFGAPPRSRPLSGLGSSMRPEILDAARIDEVVYVDENDMIAGCHRLLTDHGLMLGASSGGAYTAASRHPRRPGGPDPVVAFICPDLGRPYIDNVFNPDWVARLGDGPRATD